jgi:hypothetical protein
VPATVHLPQMSDWLRHNGRIKLSEEPTDSAGGPLSALTDVHEVVEDILNLSSNLFADYQPKNEAGKRAIFELGASITRGGTGDDELDDSLRDIYLGFADTPRAQWKIEFSLDDVSRIAQTLVVSNKRPDTQILGPSQLEILVRDETIHSVLRPPSGTSVSVEFVVAGRRFTVTVGPPSTELVIRCALRREGMEQLEVFDRDQLNLFLAEREKSQSLTAASTTRISALRLLKVMTKSDMLSLQVAGESRVDAEELEQIATAYRVRIAYETSIVYAPILDVNRLNATPRQPSVVRQIESRSPEFIAAIGRGVPTGFMGDRLLGSPAVADNELSLRYLRAVAARDPFSAFMGYYHVLEYGMNDAWFDDLKERAASVGGILQRPEDDIRKAAREAAAALGVKREDVAYFEPRALRAVVSRLKIDTFTNDLRRHLDGSLEYFKGAQPIFADVEPLDFMAVCDDETRAALATKLADRIYTIRCAITHSKASTKRYSPYVDDLHLAREVPLVRIAAEQLLIPASNRI